MMITRISLYPIGPVCEIYLYQKILHFCPLTEMIYEIYPCDKNVTPTKIHVFQVKVNFYGQNTT